MKKVISSRSLVAALGCALVFSSVAHASTTIYAFGGVIDGDDEGGYQYHGFSETSDTLFDVGGQGSGEVVYEWSEGSMTLEGEAKARTELIAGGWRQRAYARASLTNPHHFTADDPPGQYAGGDGYLPHIFGAHAVSRIVTTLQYGSTATGYISTPIFRVSGDITNINTFNNPYAYVGIQIYNAGVPSSFVFEESFDEWIVGQSAMVSGGGQTLDILISASVQFYTKDHLEGHTEYTTWEGEADFYHTLELVGFDVRDVEGNLVSGFEIFDSTGALIPIVDVADYVPEPSSALLVLLSGLAICHRRSRRG
jgi:hypothetical protein